ncbi:MAG: ribosome maturation factor RimM [Rickettsiaceae bacterium]
MIDTKKLIFVGIISSANGLQGNVIVKSFTDPIEDICNLQLIAITNNTKQMNEQSLCKKQLDYASLKFIRHYSNDGYIICRFNELDSRTKVEPLIKTKFFVPRLSLSQTKENEFYIHDLINLDVVNNDIKKIGIVQNAFNFNGNSFVEIKFNPTNLIETFAFTHKFFPVVSKNYILIADNALQDLEEYAKQN